MTFKQKKQKLKGYKALKDLYTLLGDEISEIELRALELASKTTVGELDKIRTSGGLTSDKVKAYLERDEIYKQKIARFNVIGNQMSEIEKAIERITCEAHKGAVYSYFVLDMSLDEVAFSYKISKKTAQRYRDAGIRKIVFRKNVHH